MTAQTDPGAVFVDYRPGSRRWKVVLAAALVVATLVGAAYAVRAAVSSPDSAVRAYFDALAERDVDAALSAVAPEVAAQVERDVIDEAVLRSDAYQPPSEVEVAETTVDGRGAVADVSYLLDDRRYAVSLRLRRDDGAVDKLVPRWLVVDAVGSIMLGETAPGEVTVNGQRVRAYDENGPRVLRALPGAYQVAVPADDPAWQQRAVTARVEPQGAAEVAVPMVVRPEMRQEVEQRIVALLDDCAASAELLPPGCPFGYAVLAGADEVEWQITGYPTVALSAGRELGETVLVVTTSTEGEAVVTGVRDRGGEFRASVPFPVSGVALPRAGGVIFQPGW